MTTCGPWVCEYPPVEKYSPGDLWTCPRCWTQYRMSRPIPHRWWRNWAAPNGHWTLKRKP